MSNDDKRRRQDGSTAKLSVADLLARREAETQPIPRITERINDDEETVRFSAAALASAASKSPVTNLSGRELHITELLRREGRAGEEERGGGFSVPKLVAMASGGVVLAGTVAFSASSLMSSPDERPLAEVRFDARAAARGTNPLTKDLGAAAAKQQQAQQAQAETTTTTPEQTPQQTAEQTTRRAPQPAPRQTTTTTTEQAPATEAPTSTSQQTTTPPPPSTSTGTTTPAPPPSTSTPPPASSGTTTPPPPSEPNDPGIGLDIGLDLGGILSPLGGFDFFAPAS
ncbi:membrane peptidoglycan carboxypeptidase [Saccharothrix ecbatanensis]|uniref:Membrane peptidoglycan carboxypeptidase n=1 Tax=Saccharothrix ecbatanensis TaxID=1105145 RepID=A0A7W9M3K0_9PSEU|nr:hypothetical protein [Saccharothrix ecbatanensis]MBB5806111.1 membrane peptidoglycan carboxypeptidase [Saccharothrix ecbatanensis]